MSCTNYKVIEMYNNALGAQAINAMLPLGRVTRRISKCNGSGVPFEITTSGADVLLLTEKGYYKVLYNASLAVTATAATPVTLTLLADGEEIASVTTTAGATGTYNLTIAKEVRVFANCENMPTNCPVALQIQLSGSAITGGSAILIVDSCVNG